MKDLKQDALKALKTSGSGKKEVYATADGNIFFDKSLAQLHATKSKQKMETFSAEDESAPVEDELQEAEKAKVVKLKPVKEKEKEKAEVATKVPQEDKPVKETPAENNLTVNIDKVVENLNITTAVDAKDELSKEVAEAIAPAVAESKKKDKK